MIASDVERRIPRLVLLAFGIVETIPQGGRTKRLIWRSSSGRYSRDGFLWASRDGVSLRRGHPGGVLDWSPRVAGANPVEDTTPVEEGSMRERQLDLFSASGIPREGHTQPDFGRQELVTADLDDSALVAAIPWAGLAEAPALAFEAGRRRLVAAVPALEQLCRRLAGFGLERAVPEQVAALDALALIGGSKAAETVVRLIAKDVVQGPTRKVAVNVAARLKSALPVETVLALLQDADPEVRADACRCAGPWPAALQVLLELADDGDSNVRVAAACALGRMGRREARQALAHLLRDAPSVEVIDAIPAIADEDCVILLGRIVRTQPALAGAALDALETVDHPRARQIVATIIAGRDG